MTFKQYLKHIGINLSEKSSEELAFLRVEYRRFYNRQYSKEYRKKFKRFDVQYSHLENETIQKVAGIYKVKPATLIHHVSMAYLESEVYLPSFQSLEEATYLIRKSSNNINQLVKATHIQKQIHESRLIQMVEELRSIVNSLEDLYKNPKIIYKPINLITNAH